MPPSAQDIREHYTGTLIKDAIATVDRALKPSPMNPGAVHGGGNLSRVFLRRVEELIASVDPQMKRTGDAFLDLAEAKTVLADRHPMTAFDEAKWWRADRLQVEALEGSKASESCIANVNDFPCGKKAVGETEMCPEHLAEFGL